MRPNISSTDLQNFYIASRHVNCSCACPRKKDHQQLHIQSPNRCSEFLIIREVKLTNNILLALVIIREVKLTNNILLALEIIIIPQHSVSNTVKHFFFEPCRRAACIILRGGKVQLMPKVYKPTQTMR